MRYDQVMPVTEVDAPTPTAVRHRWWPAEVKLPDEPRPRRNLRVFATPEGLYVYSQAAMGSPNAGRLIWWSPIHYDETPKPVTGYAAQNVADQIHTDAGIVFLKTQGGCGCGFSRLKNWRPEWATRTQAWEG